MNSRARIYVAGGGTLLGSTLVDHFQKKGYDQLLGVGRDEPDLTNPGQVEDFFADTRPEYVFMTAGMTGGIAANQNFPAVLLRDNLQVTLNVIDAAYRHSVEKLLFVGSSCMYPRLAPQPLRPDSLFSGPLEPTNAAYAFAKLTGVQLCQAYRQQHGARFIAAIPANSFGPHDDFNAHTGHVIPALMQRMHLARIQNASSLTIWGSGSPQREFIYAGDLAEACVFVMANYENEAPINLGSGLDLSIAETAKMIAQVVGFRGRLDFDLSQPDGTPRKGLDSSPLFKMGWRPRTDFMAALAKTYAWMVEHLEAPHVRTAV